MIKGSEDSQKNDHMSYGHNCALQTFLQVHQGIKGMVLDENHNNLAEAVISVSGINHDITSGRWPLLSGVRRKPSCPHLFSNMIRRPVCKPVRPVRVARTLKVETGGRKDDGHRDSELRGQD